MSVIETFAASFTYSYPIQRIPYTLAALSDFGVQSPTPTWVDAIGTGAYLDATLLSGAPVMAIVEGKAQNAGVSLTPRIIDDLGVVAGTGAIITSQALTLRTFAITLAAGLRRYRLQLLPGTANEDVFASAYLEVNR